MKTATPFAETVWYVECPMCHEVEEIGTGEDSYNGFSEEFQCDSCKGVFLLEVEGAMKCS